jgi:tetratricopeptide (TPR) repeat protein
LDACSYAHAIKSDCLTVGLAAYKRARSDIAERVWVTGIAYSSVACAFYLRILLAEQGRPGQAEAGYREAIRIDPEYTVHQTLVRGVELIREKKVHRAMDELNEGLRVAEILLNDAPSDVRLIVQLGYLYRAIAQAFTAAESNEQADKFLERTLKMFELVKEIPAEQKTAQDIANSINGVGNVYYARGNLEKAIENYGLATTMFPDYAYAWHDMFGAYNALGRTGKIDIEAMREALQKVKDTGQGLPGLSAGYVAQLEGFLKYWEQIP